MKRSEFIKNVLAFGAVIGLAPKVMAQYPEVHPRMKNLPLNGGRNNFYTYPSGYSEAYLIPDAIELKYPGCFVLKFKSQLSYPQVGDMLLDDLEKKFLITAKSNLHAEDFSTELTIKRARVTDIYERKKNFLSSRRRHGKKIVNDVTGKTFVVFCNSMRERS